jgi:hypothetical protein
LSGHWFWGCKLASEVTEAWWCYRNMEGEKTQERRCNETLRRFRVTVLKWKSNNRYISRLCVCSLSYPACKEQVLFLYGHLLNLRPYVILPHYLISATIFGGKKNWT